MIHIRGDTESGICLSALTSMQEFGPDFSIHNGIFPHSHSFTLIYVNIS